jgi:Zn-finger nucleic acid-binding protein
MRHLVACSHCGRQFDVGERPAGSRFQCSCGGEVEVAAPAPHDAAVVRCSSCGAPREGEEEACRYCGSTFTLHERDLDTICPGCMALVSGSARFCHHCGCPILVGQATAGATSLHCPVCPGESLRSRRLGTESLAAAECARCGGLWLDNTVFEIVATRARQGQIASLPFQPRREVTGAPQPLTTPQPPLHVDPAGVPPPHADVAGPPLPLHADAPAGQGPGVSDQAGQGPGVSDQTGRGPGGFGRPGMPARIDVEALTAELPFRGHLKDVAHHFLELAAAGMPAPGSAAMGPLVPHAPVLGVPQGPAASPAPPARAGGAYRPCAVCGALMNRRNYGRSSGVILDVCQKHGIWFGLDGLPRLLAWIHDGGEERARQRAVEEAHTAQSYGKSEAALARFSGSKAWVDPEADAEADLFTSLSSLLGDGLRHLFRPR